MCKRGSFVFMSWFVGAVDFIMAANLFTLLCISIHNGSRGGLIVSALGSGSGGPGSSLGQGPALCS